MAGCDYFTGNYDILPFLQVKWAKDDLDGYLNLFSVSGDGRVTNWTIIKTFLTFSDVFKLSFTKNLFNMGEEDMSNFLVDGEVLCIIAY